MTGSKARTIAYGLTERQRNTLRGVVEGKMIAEWREELLALRNFGLVEAKPDGKRFEVTLTEGGRVVAHLALH